MQLTNTDIADMGAAVSDVNFESNLMFAREHGCQSLWYSNDVQLESKVCIQSRYLLSRTLRTQQQRNLAGGAAYSAQDTILCVHQCDRCGAF